MIHNIMVNEELGPQDSHQTLEEKLVKHDERLEEFLTGSELGSVKYNALVDCASFMNLVGTFQLDRRESRDHNPLTIARWAVITETIRQRRFGEQGPEYNSAFKEASGIITGLGLAYRQDYDPTGDSDWEKGADHVMSYVIHKEDLEQVINVPF